MHEILEKYKIYRIVNFICRKILKMNWLRFLNVARTFPNDIFPDVLYTVHKYSEHAVFNNHFIFGRGGVYNGCVYKINRYLNVCKCLFLEISAARRTLAFCTRASLRNLIKHCNPSSNFSLRCLLPLVFYKLYTFLLG